MRTTARSELAVATALSLAFSCTAVAAPTACRPDGRYVMGTVLEVDVCGDVAVAVVERAFATAHALDASLTTWADDSPVLRLNRAHGETQPDVPEALRALLAEAIEYERVTAGAFDVTVGPLIAVWREAGRRRTAPPPARLEQARARVGSRRIELGPDGSVRLPAGMALDFGGLAKGFALDRIAADLRRDGVDSALLDFGQSSLVALGAPPDAPSWDLLVRRPDGPAVGVVSLRDAAASVSATFGHSVRIGGKRHSHVIDPRSGQPVARDRLAFVVASKASRAEALSTALVVLGDAGMGIVERLRGVEALLLEDGDAHPSRTSGFDRATGFRPL